ncbi:ankyrin repeat domain-containing protein 60 [Amblyraja radiata]|uniref:ankyrin repeat domain-containing protein 60 n=1 Tax=Amblyraja radiata TaxID=386614 RepID=UPI001403099F|nr:ankyrin repeat domain-containing protein 60 [Amblyraja radiata]
MLPRKTFDLRVHVEATGEKFRITECSNNMTIREMKSKLELITAIPTNYQRLYYIDEGEMPDNVTLKFNGIISGGIIRLKTWSQDGLDKLFEAAALGYMDELLALGVTKDSDYTTPNSKRMDAKAKAVWNSERNFVALLIAAHRGHVDIVRYLLKNGSNLNTKTIDGHSALHMAVVGASGQCITFLLSEGGIAIGIDRTGRTVLDMARVTDHKENVGKLLQFQWMKRTADLKPAAPIEEADLFAHQRFDSTLKTWKTGTHGKIYMANLLKPRGPRGARAEQKHHIPRKGGRKRPMPGIREARAPGSDPASSRAHMSLEHT